MENYIISPSLQKAVEIARFLKKPLLLCGEPGTGKTRLAYYLAQELSRVKQDGRPPFLARPLVFNTKTTSNANDLFYYYDGLGRLRDAYGSQTKPTIDYITFNAFGRAIIYTRKALPPFLQNRLDAERGPSSHELPVSSVVLIDEIDKAPRDFPNDLLNEIEKYSFDIKELNEEVALGDKNAEILVIMTSNNEKNFPDAFLRRCVFHYIDFPDDQDLKRILQVHTGNAGTATPADTDRWSGSSNDQDIDSAITTIKDFRKLPTVKKPSTSEIINWVQYVGKEGLFQALRMQPGQRSGEVAAGLKSSLGILFKTTFDLKLAEEQLMKS